MNEVCDYCGWCDESGLAHDCRKQLMAEIERLKADCSRARKTLTVSGNKRLNLEAEVEQLSRARKAADRRTSDECWALHKERRGCREEIERRRKSLQLLAGHPLIMQEGGVNDCDRAIRVMNKQEQAIERLKAEVDEARQAARKCWQVIYKAGDKPITDDVCAALNENAPWLEDSSE